MPMNVEEAAIYHSMRERAEAAESRISEAREELALTRADLMQKLATAEQRCRNAEVELGTRGVMLTRAEEALATSEAEVLRMNAWHREVLAAIEPLRGDELESSVGVINRTVEALAIARAREVQLTDLIEDAWGVIANAQGGNWKASTGAGAKFDVGWRDAAVRWRERYHSEVLALRGTSGSPPGLVAVKVEVLATVLGLVTRVIDMDTISDDEGEAINSLSALTAAGEK
jgi:hypothetical protein